MNQKTDLIQRLKNDLPTAFGRAAVDRLLPGIISSKSLANLASLGLGPQSYKHGRKVFYEKEEFLEWLSRRVRRVEGVRG